MYLAVFIRIPAVSLCCIPLSLYLSHLTVHRTVSVVSLTAHRHRLESGEHGYGQNFIELYTLPKEGSRVNGYL